MSNPFSLLGLPPRFDLDPDVLQTRFLAESSQHHPDRFTDPLDQADAAERSAAINHAHRTLSDPEARARALLTHLGVAPDEADPALPPALLMEVMEIREEMESAVANQDAPALARLRSWAQQQRHQHLSDLSAKFAADPVDTAAVRQTLGAYRYVQRMLDQMPS